MSIVTRFSPSPTGFLHLGGLRTALYSYLFAKKHGGRFLLRIEDTDQERTVEGAVDYIINSLKWVGIENDGEILVQSNRLDIYKKYALELVEKGFAYYAFDTKEELAALRGNDPEKPVSYNAYTRERMVNSLSLSKDAVDVHIAHDVPYVIRFKTPKNREIKFQDEIRGMISFNTNNIDDKVIFKSDGYPTYHLANILDDILSGVTHVIRGQEWLSSVPLHIMLYEALGHNPPVWAHLSLILGDDGKKLSKRHGDKYGYPVFPLSGEYVDEKGKTVSVNGFKEAGYLPEALLNAVALIGWTPKGSDMLPVSEMIEQFELKDVHAADAIFNIVKLKNINKEYLKKKDLTYLYSFIDKGNTFTYDNEKLSLIANIALERSTFNYELNSAVDYFFNAISYAGVKYKHKDMFIMFGDKISNGKWEFDSIDSVSNIVDFNCATIDVQKGEILPDLRNALTGGKSGAGLIETMFILGVDETKRRIENYCKHLATLVAAPL